MFPGVPTCNRFAELVKSVLLDEAMRAEVCEIPVADEGTAAAMGFAGSPTVLVDGRDVEPSDIAGQTGLSCRLYAATASGVPSREMLLRAIRETRSAVGTR